MREAGVGDDLIVWRDGGRLGLYFLERGSDPRPSRVLYDRADSCVAQLKPGDVDWDSALDGCAHFHTTGITAALSRGCLELLREGLFRARARGISTSLDFNYRSALWSRERARRALLPLLSQVNHLILSPGDGALLLNREGMEPEAIARALTGKFGCDSVAMTMREDLTHNRTRWSAMAWDGAVSREGRCYELEVVDRIGAGDAFAAGYIYGVLHGDLDLALRAGGAMAALKHGIPGDMLIAHADEVEEILEEEGKLSRLRR